MKQEKISSNFGTHPVSRQTVWPDVLMFAYGAGWSFAVKFVGAIFVAEIVALMCLPLVGAPQVLRRYPLLRRAVFAYGLIMVGLIVADIANKTEFDLAMKGWANPLFAAGSIVFVVALLDKRPRAIVSYLLGVITFSLIFGAASFSVGGRERDLSLGDALIDSNSLKIRIIPFLLPLIIVIAHYMFKKNRIISTVFVFLCSILLMILDARGAALILFVVALITGNVRPGRKVQLRQFMGILLAGLIVGYAGYFLYVSQSDFGSARGHTAGQLARIENPYNPLELLGVGRSEWLTAPEAVSVSPILGNGSWAYDVSGRFTHLRALRANDERNYFFSYRRETNLIPTHSVLLACWIWGGLIGLWGAGLLAMAIWRAILGAIKARSDLLVISAFCAASLIWDFLFSPFQAIRLSFPFALGFVIVIASKSAPALSLRGAVEARGSARSSP